MYNLALSILIILGFTTHLSIAENISISVKSPYTQADRWFTTPKMVGESGSFTFSIWTDTISFSNGITFSFTCFNLTSTPFMYYSNMLAIGLIKGASEIIYNKHKITNKTNCYPFQIPPFPFQWQYQQTFTSDTLWNSALKYPQQKSDADSLLILITKEDTTFTFNKGRVIAKLKKDQNDIGWPHADEIVNNFNAIIYIKSVDNTHMKIQFFESVITTKTVGPNNSSSTNLERFRMRWAVDSIGNGLFKDDQTPNVTSPSFKKNQLLMSQEDFLSIRSIKKDNSVNLSLSNYTTLNQIDIKIINPLGKSIVSTMINKYNPSITLYNIIPGCYILTSKTPDAIYQKKLIFP